MWTQTSQPTQRSRSISHQLCMPGLSPYCWILTMQSTGQTSKHASQPVQLSALMTASSLGSFLRGPCLAIVGYLGECEDSRQGRVSSQVCLTIIGRNRLRAKQFGHEQVDEHRYADAQ